MELVAALVRIQQNARMTDAEFAETLGVPRATWNGYRRGNPVSLPFMRRALAVYPQVARHAEGLLHTPISKKSGKGGKSRTTA